MNLQPLAATTQMCRLPGTRSYPRDLRPRPPGLGPLSFCTNRYESAILLVLSKGAGAQQWLIGENNSQRRSSIPS